MIKFQYKIFQTSEEFEKWQLDNYDKYIDNNNIIITQVSPILLEMTGQTKTIKNDKNETSNLSFGSLPYGIFVVYYYK